MERGTGEHAQSAREKELIPGSFSMKVEPPCTVGFVTVTSR
jgi:hypothetical protein